VDLDPFEQRIDSEDPREVADAIAQAIRARYETANDLVVWG